LALKLAKRLIDKAYDTDLETGLALEVQAFTACFATEDAREGIRAFLDRRQPRFRGK